MARVGGLTAGDGLPVALSESGSTIRRRACSGAVRAALQEEGSIGVIVAVRKARVAVVPAGLAKGLEYDHVVVVEPANIVEAEQRGLNRLYVVLTRAVSRLDVLHTRDLPPALR